MIQAFNVPMKVMFNHGKFYFEGKRPGLPPGHQIVIDPYIGGFLPADEVCRSLKAGAFASGLIGRLVDEGREAWYEIIATAYDLYGECCWDLQPIEKPSPGEITHFIYDGC